MSTFKISDLVFDSYQSLLSHSNSGQLASWDYIEGFTTAFAVSTYGPLHPNLAEIVNILMMSLLKF